MPPRLLTSGWTPSPSFGCWAPAYAKDVWLLGIGLSFVVDAILSRGDGAR